MAVSDIFSKRRKRESGETDVYRYDEVPDTLRVQIIYILKDLIGTPNVGGSPANEIYDHIHHLLAREYGKPELAFGRNGAERLFAFIRETFDASQVLDAIEVSFHNAESSRGYSDYRFGKVPGVVMSVAEAAEELNIRFQEASIGYQFESGCMIRIDSQVAHAEIVKPALTLLSDKRYSGAEEEFLTAHKHYRQGNHKECLTECLKAFESTMKTICEIRHWPYNKTDTAKKLIDLCFKNGLIPSMLQTQINALQMILESGVPTLRNKMSGHGQGAVPTAVLPNVAAYGLHLTAANIVFLVTAEKALTKP